MKRLLVTLALLLSSAPALACNELGPGYGYGYGYDPVTQVAIVTRQAQEMAARAWADWQANGVGVAQELLAAQWEGFLATGVVMPAVVVPGINNAYAGPGHVGIGTGLPKESVRGVYFHELSHHLYGHVSTPWGEQRPKEAQADFGAGQLLARSGHGNDKHMKAYKDMVGGHGGWTHGSGSERQAAADAGAAAAKRNPWFWWTIPGAAR